MSCNYDIVFIKKLLELKQEELTTLKSFINEIKFFYRDPRFYSDDFIRKVDLIVNNKKNFYFFSPYKKIIEQYSDLLKVLIDKNILKDIMHYIEGHISCFLTNNLLSHIIEFYGKKQLMTDNIERFNQLGVKFLEYGYNDEIEFEKVEEKGQRNSEDYILSSFYSDGKQKWNKIDTSKEDNCANIDNDYIVNVQNWKYIIRYNKSKSQGLTELKVLISGLDFDISTLPSLEELNSTEKWQCLGDEQINAIDNINLLKDFNKQINEKSATVEDRLKQFADRKEYLDILTQLRVLSVSLNNLSKLVTESYITKQVITEEDFQKEFLK